MLFPKNVLAAQYLKNGGQMQDDSHYFVQSQTIN